MSTNLICFGDVVKLSTKSAFVDGDDSTSSLGFLPQKSEMVLVVSPVKDELQSSFLEAEFIVAHPVRDDDKSPPNGTPLHYKQPFVLLTSDGSGYSLNNKTPSMTDVLSLRERNIKGEMFVAFEKEGMDAEAQVHDLDVNLELNVVDSNRIRKKYNNQRVGHFSKAKSDAAGGFVTCGSKNKSKLLTFKIEKIAGKTETRAFIKDPVFRRASQILAAGKADEVSEASVLESPSRAGSIIATSSFAGSPPASPKSAAAASKFKAEEAPETQPAVVEPPAAVAAASAGTRTGAGASTETTAAPAPVVAASATTKTTPAVETTTTVAPLTTSGGVNPVELDAQLSSVAVVSEVQTVAVAAAPPQPMPPSTVSAELQSALAAAEIGGGALEAASAVNGSAPVHVKVPPASATAAPAKPAREAEAAALKTETSELDTLAGPMTVHEEQLDPACVGKCAIM